MFSNLKALWSLMGGFRRQYALAMLCLVLTVFLNYGVPLVGSAVIDHAISDQPAAGDTPFLIALFLRCLGGAENLRTHLRLAPLAMVVLSAASGLFTYLKGWQASLASDGIARRLKDQLYDHLNHLPATHHDRSDTGDLVQRCTSDVETARQFLAAQVMEIGNALILGATALPLLLSLSVPLTLVSFALIIPIVLYGYIYFRQVKHYFKEVDEAEGALTAVIQENLTGIRVVRAFARHDHERAKFAVPNARYRDRNLHLLRLMAWYWSVSDVVAIGQIGLTLIVGAKWIVDGTATVGLLFAFLSYLAIMLWPLRQMGRILTDLGKTSVALGRIKEILGVLRESSEAPVAQASFPSPLLGRIAVKDLHFFHTQSKLPEEGRGALNGISFEVQPGETLAILGPSGSGKSTLMHLLLRLYDYTAGSITFDGRELSTLPRAWVRGQIGAVMQEPFLFSKTLRDNLRLGHGDAPEDEIEAAARMASIHDTILSFEQGYDTLIGERGITLSGGQRQRVAIARAVLKRPPVLILDDAMSAIDAETESAILDALRQRRGRATTLVIAHRLSTLAHADRVIVLDHGHIIQSGTHAQLAAQEGLYRRLWQIQTSVESDFKAELTSVDHGPFPFQTEDDFQSQLDTGLWWKIFRRALTMKRYLVPLFISSVFIAICDAGFAFVTRWVIDGVVRDGAQAAFGQYITVYALMTVAFCAGVWTFIYMAGNLSNRLAHDVRRDCFDKLQQLEFSYFDTRPVGWLISRLTSDCDRLARVISWGFLDIVWGISYVIMIAASLLYMNWRLGLIIIAIVPPLAVISKYFQRHMLLSSREIRKFNSQITAGYNESIQGVRTTKTLVRERENLDEFQQLSTRMFDASVLNARQNAIYFPIVTTLGSLAAGLALWRGGYLAAHDAISLGTLVTFINFSGQFFQPINQLAQRLTEMQGAQAAGERVMGLLATEPQIKDSAAVLARSATAAGESDSAGGPLAAPGFTSIEFRHVTFRYATGPVVLHDFSLDVRAGETIALVGPSGGGKSTIVSLACRFYEPTGGEIRINGVDYRERPLAWLQSQLGIVLQTPHLFKGTVRDNIRYGRLDATDEEVESAAKLVNAHEFIVQMEHGYEAQVGEGGNRLSTGQRQLLSFARALLANPQIFVMDEATSSIDTETEQLIQRGLETIFAGRISFVIAHRLSTIRRADRILVITNGRVEEVGTHAELLQQRGHYYELYTSQFRRERAEEMLSKT